jgi:toxin ParE1/3/4
MKFTVHEDAKDEATRHIAWYAKRNPRAAQRLSELLADASLQIANDPTRFPLLEYRRNPGNVRRALLKKFPILVLYQLLDDEIYVFAVAHTAQRPGYWRSRLKP